MAFTGPDPFDTDIRMTVQALGWRSGGRYLPLGDYIASTAWRYAVDPGGSRVPSSIAI